MSVVSVPDTASRVASFAKLAALHEQRPVGQWLRVSLSWLSRGRVERIHGAILLDVDDRVLLVRTSEGASSRRLDFTVAPETPAVWVWTLAEQAEAEES